MFRGDDERRRGGDRRDETQAALKEVLQTVYALMQALEKLTDVIGRR